MESMKNRNFHNSKIKEWIANGAMIVLSISLVIIGLVLISEMRYMNYSYSYNDSDFWYSIEDGRYASIVEMRWKNEYSKEQPEGEMEQCYAIADYFEAASLYKVAMAKEDAVASEKYLDIMQEKYKIFEDVSFVAEDINQKLDIEFK